MIYSITKNNHIITIVDQDISQGQSIYKSFLIDCNYPIEINKDNQMSFINAHNQSNDVYQFNRPQDIKKFLKYYQLKQYGCKSKSIWCIGTSLLIILGALGCFMFNNNHAMQIKSQNEIASPTATQQPQMTQERMDSLATDFFLQEANKIRQQQPSSLLPMQPNPSQQSQPAQQQVPINNEQGLQQNSTTNSGAGAANEANAVSDDEFLKNLNAITQ